MVQKILKIAIFQIDLAWENPQANREKIDRLLGQLPAGVDLVVLPEMFSTGFTMNTREVAEMMHGETVEWMKQRCHEHQIALCGSLNIIEDGHYYNRLLFVAPNANVCQYDKRHLFTMAGENNYFKAGKKRQIVQYKGWRICPLVCYDLRFPVWSRNQNNFDLMIYVANWPESRNEVWTTLLKARAIENQSYLAGANRVGVDGNKISYSGNSLLIGPKGNILASNPDADECILTAEFSFEELSAFRAKFPVLDDADDFEIK